MRYLVIISVLLYFSTESLPTPPDVADVFPLKRGNTFRYSYSSYHSYYNPPFGYSDRDSGFVEYSVVDSTHINDSTILWSIAELQNLTHTHDNWFSGGDTTFTIADSSEIILEESTSGNHALRCASLIWRFPSVVDNDSVPIYRYRENTDVIFSHTQLGCIASGLEDRYDSIRFTGDSGMSHREWFGCKDIGDMFGETWKVTSELISSIIVAVEDRVTRPAGFELLPNYPNPFNSTTTIVYRLDQPSRVRISIYGTQGIIIDDILLSDQPPGVHHHTFDAASLASGVYFARIQADHWISTLRLLYIK